MRGKLTHAPETMAQTDVSPSPSVRVMERLSIIMAAGLATALAVDAAPGLNLVLRQNSRTRLHT